MIVDSFQRVHDYLRISLTDACNLRCFYCMPEEDYAFTPASRLMQQQEIVTLAKLFVSMGVRKIRLTGGEPLIRKDAAAIIEALGTLPVELTLTTNATQVHRFIDVLQRAEVASINVSLDSLQPEKFQRITRRDKFRDVWSNLQLLLANGFRVKLNVVVTKGLNDEEIDDFIALTKETPIEVRFIEFMPFDGNRWTSEKVMSWQEILRVITEKHDFMPLKTGANATAKAYKIPGHVGSFAVISTMSAPFCATCNRLRLTADGKLKNCLFSTGEADLLTPLRLGQDIGPLIHQAVQKKAASLGGQFTPDYGAIDGGALHNRSMIAIGG